MIAGLADPAKISNGLSVDKETKYILIRSDPGVVLVLKKGVLGIVAYKSSQSKYLLKIDKKSFHFFF